MPYSNFQNIGRIEWKEHLWGLNKWSKCCDLSAGGELIFTPFLWDAISISFSSQLSQKYSRKASLEGRKVSSCSGLLFQPSGFWGSTSHMSSSSLIMASSILPDFVQCRQFLLVHPRRCLGKLISHQQAIPASDFPVSQCELKRESWKGGCFSSQSLLSWAESSRRMALVPEFLHSME